MLHFIGQLMQDHETLSFLRVLEYITVRSAFAFLFSFIFCIAFGPATIRRLRKMQAIQYIRVSSGENAISLDEMHSHKGGTPSMGGVLMLGAICASILFFTDLSQPVVWLVTLGTLGFCFIGFLDDYLKTVKKNSDGLSAKKKLISQVLIGGAFAVLYLYCFPEVVQYSYMTESGKAVINSPAFVLLPFMKEAIISLGWFYLPFAVFVLTASSNSVNLTDGLDGLAAGVTLSVTLCFAMVAYLAGRVDDSTYLYIPYIAGAGELTVVLCSLAGACMGFLWFNAHPAEMFMGDTGSMMLGGLLGSVALLTKQEILLVLVGGVFVAETLSVILQVGSYKLRKKRIFRMAPLHHHFERGGVPESKIIARFWIVSALLAIAGLATLKIR